MIETRFNRNRMARRYALGHLRTEAEVRSIYYLPQGAPDREVRLVEIKDRIAQPEDEPLDFGVAIGPENPHTLLVMQINTARWEAIRSGEASLPDGWTLEGAVRYCRR